LHLLLNSYPSLREIEALLFEMKFRHLKCFLHVPLTWASFRRGPRVVKEGILEQGFTLCANRAGVFEVVQQLGMALDQRNRGECDQSQAGRAGREGEGGGAHEGQGDVERNKSRQPKRKELEVIAKDRRNSPEPTTNEFGCPATDSPASSSCAVMPSICHKTKALEGQRTYRGNGATQTKCVGVT
jgi:hypothetical protein